MRRRVLLATPAVLSFARQANAADRIKVGMLKPNIVTAIYWIAVKTRSRFPPAKPPPASSN